MTDYLFIYFVFIVYARFCLRRRISVSDYLIVIWYVSHQSFPFLAIMSEARKRGRPRIHAERKRAKLGRGVVLHSQGREMVCAVREYFEKEREHGGPLLNVNKVVDRTADCLKISKTTVVNIRKEKERNECEQEEAGPSSAPVLRTPGKIRPHEKRVTKMDAFTEDAVRRHVYSYYLRKEHPTLQKLVVSLREAQLFNGSPSSLRNCLNDLGFKYEKFNNRLVLMERTDIVAWRCRYLREIRKIDLNKVIWLDETWVNAGHTLTKGWTDRTIEGTTKAPLGKGERLIVLHAGSASGFIPNCCLIFRSKKTGDFHDEMNGDCFTRWFTESLLKNIPAKSVIVLDNAPYHSVIYDKAPTMRNVKAEILGWLEKSILPKYPNLELEPEMTKAELMNLVNLYKPTPTYVIDNVAKNSNHKVIRLPPYHADFNPIENIWAQVKGHVARENQKFTIKEVERLTREGIDRVSSEDWAKAVKRVKNITDEAWQKEGILEECVESMIISLHSSSESEEDEVQEQEEIHSDSSLGVAPLTP